MEELLKDLQNVLIKHNASIIRRGSDNCLILSTYDDDFIGAIFEDGIDANDILHKNYEIGHGDEIFIT